MEQLSSRIHMMEDLLNESYRQNSFAQESNHAYVNGFFRGVMIAITALGYRYCYDTDYQRMTVVKDIHQKQCFKKHLNETKRIAEDHFLSMLNAEDAEKIWEVSLMNGMNEVLQIFEKEMIWNPATGRFDMKQYCVKRLYN